MSKFHKRCGNLVKLSENRRSAMRVRSVHEFNNGIVFTAEPLQDDVLFEVKIENIISSWSGSIEIGVVACNPNVIDFPASATGFSVNSWILSGRSLLRHGQTYRHEYGTDLDSLKQGDRVGVMRTSQGGLFFYVNGENLGLAVNYVPRNVYGVVDIYGKCVKLSIVDGFSQSLEILSNQLTNEALSRATLDESREKLTFNERCGSLITFTNQFLTAERRRANDEFNNGVVMTNRPLKNDELFEIRIDDLVSKWSGSIEVGITTHDPTRLDFPATMTNMRSGTIMMSGCGILVNGKGTRREYGDYNLDDLKVGDRIGLRRKSNGILHYYINGCDQGEASTDTPAKVWGVVDLYGMTVKVTIVSEELRVNEMERSTSEMLRPLFSLPIPTPVTIINNDNSSENMRPTRNRLEFLTRASTLNNLNSVIRETQFPRITNTACSVTDNRLDNISIIDENLSFSQIHAPGVFLNTDNCTASRIDPNNYFSNANVFSNRTLRTNEIFEIRIDETVSKWSGGTEIAVTTVEPENFEFVDSLQTSSQSVWLLTSKGFSIDAKVVKEDYVLEDSKKGDTIGVCRKFDGSLHFFFNSKDLGIATENVPENLYTIVNIYGQTTKIIMLPSRFDDISTDIRFHSLHGKNVSLRCNNKTAFRQNSNGEFNNAVLLSNRPLIDGELFEVLIEGMVSRWSGSIEIGVTAICPNEINFPCTMTEMKRDTWILSGSTIVKDGCIVRNDYSLDLDEVFLHDRIGVCRSANGQLHFFHNGQDMGVAYSDISSDVYAVIDLYGQCTQASILSSSMPNLEMGFTNISAINDKEIFETEKLNIKHSSNIILKNDSLSAVRISGFSGLVFSSSCLKPNRLFEIVVDAISNRFTGSLSIGVTSANNLQLKMLPSDIFGFSESTWFINQSNVYKNGTIIQENFLPTLCCFSCSITIGICMTDFGEMLVYLNGIYLGIAANNINEQVYAVVDLYGTIAEISLVTNQLKEITNLNIKREKPIINHLQEINLNLEKELQFDKNFGKNIQLLNKGLARRISSFNNGLIILSHAMQRERLYELQIDEINNKWTSSLSIGFTTNAPVDIHWPTDALKMIGSCWVINGDSVFKDGLKVRSKIGINLDNLDVGGILGVKIRDDSIELHVDGLKINVINNLPPVLYMFIDIYGKCESISIIKDKENNLKDKVDKLNIDKTIKKPITCDNYKQCKLLKLFLCLPETFFAPKFDLCFCEKCVKLGNDNVTSGWCRFSLKLHPKLHNQSSRWQVAYHPTSIELVRQILDDGDPLNQKHYNDVYQKMNCNEEKNQPEISNLKQLFLSPCIDYASCSTFCPVFEFFDYQENIQRNIQVAFEVRVRPSTYMSSLPSIQFTNEKRNSKTINEIEWYTKEKGAVILTALFVRSI